MTKLKNKVALVTGSDSGIGKAIAEAYAKEGAKIVVTYHSDEDGAHEAAKGIEKEGGDVIVHKLDVSDEADVKLVFEKIKAHFGGIDILVSNAGVNGSDIPVAEMETKTFDTCIKTNLYGTFFCCREFLRLQDSNDKKGKIIIVSSIHEDVNSKGNADYNASKGGVKNFSRSLALELADKGINVNNIAPGMILTPMNQEAMDDEDVRKEAEQNIPMKRAGQPKDIAGIAVYLASEESDYVTGATFVVDGGLMINLGQGA